MAGTWVKAYILWKFQASICITSLEDAAPTSLSYVYFWGFFSSSLAAAVYIGKHVADTSLIAKLKWHFVYMGDIFTPYIFKINAGPLTIPDSTDCIWADINN